MRPSRAMMPFAAEAVAAQIQDRPRRHSDEGPGDGRADVYALAQDGIQGAGVAAARAGRKRSVRTASSSSKSHDWLALANMCEILLVSTL